MKDLRYNISDTIPFHNCYLLSYSRFDLIINRIKNSLIREYIK